MAKKKAKGKSKPRPAPPRGMYLTVYLLERSHGQDDTINNEQRISSFNDITRIGHEVARAVREYLRRVPMLAHVPAWSFTVWPTWNQTAPAKPKDHDVGQRASDLEALEEG